LGLPVEELLPVSTPPAKKFLMSKHKRIRPGLDNKILASWNGLMLKGLCEAYRAFDEPAYLELALRNADFLINNMLSGDKVLRIFKEPVLLANGDHEPIATFLDDYANIVDAFIALYEVTFDEEWLTRAKALPITPFCIIMIRQTGMFFYTADDDEHLIARKSEIMDGVIPASNSVMARNLKKLGLFFDQEDLS
jgi:uncharacterized protein YyaL (SSP411 family)